MSPYIEVDLCAEVKQLRDEQANRNKQAIEIVVDNLREYIPHLFANEENDIINADISFSNFNNSIQWNCTSCNMVLDRLLEKYNIRTVLLDRVYHHPKLRIYLNPIIYDIEQAKKFLWKRLLYSSLIMTAIVLCHIAFWHFVG